MNDKNNGIGILLSGLFEFGQAISNLAKKASEWFEENQDTIKAYIKIFADAGVWMGAVDRLSEEKLMFTDGLSLEFANEILESDNVQKTVEIFYTDDEFKHFNLLVDRCKNSKCAFDYQKFFNQIMSAYEREHYQLACTGLFSLMDRVLADNTDKSKVVNFENRIEKVKTKMADKSELDGIDKRTFCIYMLADIENGSIFERASFDEDEPTLINRHWLLHGRTKKNYEFFDFLLVMLWLDAIIFMVDSSTEDIT